MRWHQRPPTAVGVADRVGAIRGQCRFQGLPAESGLPQHGPQMRLVAHIPALCPDARQQALRHPPLHPVPGGKGYQRMAVAETVRVRQADITIILVAQPGMTGAAP